MKLVLTSLAIFATWSLSAQGVEVGTTWFDKTKCTKLEIRRLESGSKIASHSLTTADATGIRNLISEIEKISAAGDEMRSFVPKETIELEFDCGAAKKKVLIYDGWFKTPNTAFNSDAKIRKIEKQLHADILTTLKPELGKKLFKFEGVVFAFKEFTLEFKGVTKFDLAPATINGQDDHFEVRDAAGRVQKLVVTSGQLPPQPETFSIGAKKFALETFSFKDVRLYSGFVLIH